MGDGASHEPTPPPEPLSLRLAFVYRPLIVRLHMRAVRPEHVAGVERADRVELLTEHEPVLVRTGKLGLHLAPLIVLVLLEVRHTTTDKLNLLELFVSHRQPPTGLPESSYAQTSTFGDAEATDEATSRNTFDAS